MRGGPPGQQQPRVLRDGSDPVVDSRVLLFRFNSSASEPIPKTTHRLRDSGGVKTPEIRQKFIQTEIFDWYAIA